jgi:hypothetical protein
MWFALSSDRALHPNGWRYGNLYDKYIFYIIGNFIFIIFLIISNSFCLSTSHIANLQRFTIHIFLTFSQFILMARRLLSNNARRVWRKRPLVGHKTQSQVEIVEPTVRFGGGHRGWLQA